jgi:hypothetical protein
MSVLTSDENDGEFERRILSERSGSSTRPFLSEEDERPSVSKRWKRDRAYVPRLSSTVTSSSY